MFRIVDGREHFYQWDLDRQVTVDDKSITELHFCNRTDDCSLVVEVVDGIANVPNILLQNSFDIRVFGYDGKATLHDKVFKVKPRTRPADYVYTETEVLQWSSINTRMDELEAEIPNTVNELAYQYVQEAISENQELLDTVTIDVTGCPIGSLRQITTTDDIRRFVESSKAGKDTLVILRDSTAEFIATTTETYTDSNKYLLDLYGTPTYISGTATGKLNPYRYYVQIVNDLADGGITSWGSKDRLNEFATEEYVDNAIANIEIPGGDVDLSDYYTKAETDGKIEEAVEAIDIPEVDLTDYATEKYVDDAIAAIDIPEPEKVDLTNYYNKEETEALIDAIEIPEAEVIYRLVKPDTEPTEDPMDGDKALITDAHTMEYLNRVFDGEAVLGYTWRIGLNRFLITDFSKASTGRLTLKAHRLFVSTIDHYTFYIDKEDDGNWYWVGYKFEEYNIQKATEEAINTAFDNVVTAEGGAY